MESNMTQTISKILVVLLALAVLALGLLQLARPSIINHNPPIVRQPAWQDPQAEALARRACYDCHSNETRWPWYAQITPVSWLLAQDVAEARRHFNFSDWRGHDPEEIQEVVLEGEMPPALYRLMHPAARLTPAEKNVLAQGLAALR
jgi:hypothetical protein